MGHSSINVSLTYLRGYADDLNIIFLSIHHRHRVENYIQNQQLKNSQTQHP